MTFTGTVADGDVLSIKDDLLIFKNSSNEEFTDSLKQIVAILEESSNRI